MALEPLARLGRRLPQHRLACARTGEGGLSSRKVRTGNGLPCLALLSLTLPLLLLGRPLGCTLGSLRGRGTRALLGCDGIARELGRIARVSDSLVGKIAFRTQQGQARIKCIPLRIELVLLLQVSLVGLVRLALLFGQRHLRSCKGMVKYEGGQVLVRLLCTLDAALGGGVVSLGGQHGGLRASGGPTQPRELVGCRCDSHPC